MIVGCRLMVEMRNEVALLCSAREWRSTLVCGTLCRIMLVLLDLWLMHKSCLQVLAINYEMENIVTEIDPRICSIEGDFQ